MGRVGSDLPDLYWLFAAALSACFLMNATVIGHACSLAFMFAPF